MSFKSNVIVTEEVLKQTQELQAKKDELTLTRNEKAARLATIEHVMKENELLEAKAKEQMLESVDLFLEQWAKMKEYYPEVRLGILQKTLELATPKK